MQSVISGDHKSLLFTAYEYSILKLNKIALTLGTGATAEIKLHLLVIFYFVRLFTFNLAFAMKLYVP